MGSTAGTAFGPRLIEDSTMSCFFLTRQPQADNLFTDPTVPSKASARYVIEQNKLKVQTFLCFGRQKSKALKGTARARNRELLGWAARHQHVRRPTRRTG